MATERAQTDTETRSFVYLGIPQFVFDWRPSMPGPKMSVFLAVSSALTGLYVYDRRECKRIQQEYIDKVKWMSEELLPTDQRARKVKVYGARVPDDGELERGAKWFKRYMKVRLELRPTVRVAMLILDFSSPSSSHPAPTTLSRSARTQAVSAGHSRTRFARGASPKQRRNRPTAPSSSPTLPRQTSTPCLRTGTWRK
jgi:hypothetical protein